MIEAINGLMTGKVEIGDFIDLFLTSKELQKEVDELLPSEAIGNRNHEFWEKVSYESYAACGFSSSRLMKRRCKFDRTIGDDLNVFGLIETTFKYKYPEIACTKQYHELFNVYLDAVKDCFEGPEVNPTVNEIIRSTVDICPKTLRKKVASEKVKTAFHVEGNKRPYWVQGPEWPMGKNSPMKFVNRKRKGEEVLYEFIDVDTGEVRIIDQYY